MALSLLAGSAQAQERFSEWLQNFAQEAASAGISQDTLHRVLPTLSVDESVIELDQKQPEGKISFAAYQKNVLNKARIKNGRRLLSEYASELAIASKTYGVPPHIIVALWGIESSYGANTGDYDVINSLATLAYEGRRASFFRKELLEALMIVQEEGRDPMSMRGSWAGAMGQCQFMPSTYRAHAADQDGDGRRDIWDNPADVIASIAKYLAAEGWMSGGTWGHEVRLTRPISSEYIGLETQKPLSFWLGRGVRPVNGHKFPDPSVLASLVQPDGMGEYSYLVFDNYRAIMKWNKSTYFATSVGLLAEEIGAE